MPVKTPTPMSWTSPTQTAMFWAAMDEHRKLLAQRLEHARKAKGWSPERLALEADLSAKHIRRLERAEVKKPQAGTLDKLAEALGLDVRYLDQGRPTMDELEEDGGPLAEIKDKLDELLARLPAASQTPAPQGELGRRIAKPKTTAANPAPPRSRKVPGSR